LINSCSGLIVYLILRLLLLNYYLILRLLLLKEKECNTLIISSIVPLLKERD
jgi:hypothetical protein